MTVNFSLLALDQIVNTAALYRHMSGGQFGVPLVIRMATGAGRQLARAALAQPGGLVRAHARHPGARAGHRGGRARHVVAGAAGPRPGGDLRARELYNLEGELPAVCSDDIRHARVRQQGSDVSLITYGGSLPRRWTPRASSPRWVSTPRWSTCACCVRSTPPRCWHRCASAPSRWWSSRGLAQRQPGGRGHGLHRRARVLRPRRAAGARVQRGSADSVRQAPRGGGTAAGGEDRRGGARSLLDN